MRVTGVVLSERMGRALVDMSLNEDVIGKQVKRFDYRRGTRKADKTVLALEN